MPAAPATQLSLTASIQTTKGVLRIAHDVPVEAVDLVCDHAVSHGQTAKVFLPSVEGSFLLVESTRYSEPGKPLTYKTNEWVPLDAPLVLVGGAMRFLKATNGTLEVKNETGGEVRITLVGGRHATAEPV